MNTKTIKLQYPDGTSTDVLLDNVVDELYYKLAEIVTPDQKTKEIISKLDKYIPLYDIYSKNFYIINSENVFNRVINFHYRLPTQKIVDNIEKTLLTIKDKELTSFKEKLIKNVKFIKNFDLDTLEKTYYKLFYLSQPFTIELTSCVKPSFIPFLTTKPYYTKSELINLGLNMGLSLNKNLNTTCQIISDNDITSKTILTHQTYIKENSKSYIQLYTLLGSYYWNYYIRVNSCIKDVYTEKQISNLYNILSQAPSFDKNYYVYRFVDNDDYLSHLSVDDIFYEESFISTTRNPFYDTKNNVFGFILIKIKIPKDINGVGLCIESYSLFPNEEEILLTPGKLKLISIDSNYKYYHPDKRSAKKIQKLYVFEYIESLPITHILNKKEEKEIMIPSIEWLKEENKGIDFASKVYYFYHSKLPSVNNKRYFYTTIENKQYLFQAFYLNNNPIYEKYFFLLKKENIHKEEIYFTLQDETTGEILLLIEIRDTISVNYIHRFIGSPDLPFNDESLILFLSELSYYFNISQIILHDSFESYDKISKKLLQDIKDVKIEDNPDNHIVSLFSGDFNYYNKSLITNIEHTKKRFMSIPGVSFSLKDHHFKRFSTINALDLFKDVEKSPLYNILLKLNKVKITFLLDFYLYIHYNYFYLIKELDQLIINFDKYIFDKSTNPWTNSYNIINIDEYLFDKGLIKAIKAFKTNVFQDYLNKLSEEQKLISYNKYRSGLIE